MLNLNAARQSAQYIFVRDQAAALLQARVSSGPPMSNQTYAIVAQGCVEIADRLWHSLETYVIRELDPSTSVVVYDLSTACDPDSPTYKKLVELGWVPPPVAENKCQFCGAPSEYEPSEQTAPVDYCHPSDHVRLK